MYQLLEFSHPIPSCKIFELKFDEDKKAWTFIYAVETPFELTNSNTKEMIIYKHISDLIVKENVDFHEESTNIKFKTLDEYLEYLNAQYNADMKYRKSWKLNNPKAKANVLTLINDNYTSKELAENEITYISEVVSINKNYSCFTGI